MKNSKKTRSTFIALLLLFSGFILLTGCELTQPLPTTREKKPQTTSTTQQQGSKSSSTSQKETTVKPTEASVSLDKNEVTVECFKEVTLNATATGSVVWSSSDESVAKVENGVVKALKPGTATITATCGDKTATCVVTVTVSETIPLLSVDDDVEQIEVLETEGTFEVSVTPYWGLTEFEGDVVYSWKVSDGKDASLIEVTGDGNAATIKGLKAGETEITVSATFNYKSCEVTIPVTVKPASIVAEIETGDHIQLSDSTDYSYVLDLSMLESDSTITEATLSSSVFFGKNDVTENATVTFSVDDNTIASVSDSGKVQALKAGETNVVVTYTYQDSLRGEKTTTVKVHTVVSKLEVTLNEKFTVEVANLAPFTLVSSVDGNVEDLLLGETSILTSFNGNVVTLDGTKLPTTVAGGLGENKEVVLVTDKALYKFNLNIYTKIISNKDDLDGMGAIAKAAANDNGNTWDGYFVLGANIEYNAEFMGLTGKGNLWTSAGDYNALNTRGFKGVFDGKGYNINGMTITKNTYNNQSFGFIAILHPEGVIKNVSFTNAKAIDSDFLSMNIQGLVENVMIHFAELSSEVNIVGVAGGVKNHDNAVMKNCYFDCSNALITGEMIGLIEMEKNWSHKFKVENVFAVLPTGSNGKISEYANFDVLRNDATLQEALLTFDNTIWEVVNGVPCFKGLLNDTKLALTNSPLTEVKSGDTIEFEFNKFFYEASLTKADGSETDMAYSGGKIAIPNDSKYVGAYKLTVKDTYDSTNVYTFEFSVSYQMNLTHKETYDLNYSTDGKLGLATIEADFSEDVTDFGTISSVMLDGVSVKDTAVVSYNQGKLTVDVASLGKLYGEHKLVVSSSLNGINYGTTLEMFLITKVINTKADLDNMGAIAKAFSNDGGHTWDGYFALGADIEYNGLFPGMFGTGNVWSANGNITDMTDKRGFKGVFDGQGHTINGLAIEKNATGGAGSGFIPAVISTAVIKNVSFTHASVKDCGFITTTINNGATYKNIFIQYDAFYGDASDTSTFAPNNNLTSVNAEFIFIDCTKVDSEHFLNSTGGWARTRVFDRATIFNNNNYCLGVKNDVFATSESTHVVAKYADFVTENSEWQVNIKKGDSEYWDISSGMPVWKSKS